MDQPKIIIQSKVDCVIEFDLLYDFSTASACINQYDDLTLENCLDDEINPDRKLRAILKRVVEKRLWRDVHSKKSLMCCDKNYYIGDIVKVTYTPESQKYIDYYQEQSFLGRIIFIDDKCENAFFIVINSDTKNTVVKSLEREGCHYFGMSPGYSYFIESS